MCDYSRLYHQMFNAVTDAVELMHDGRNHEARSVLINAQRQAEEHYITSQTEAVSEMKAKDSMPIMPDNTPL